MRFDSPEIVNAESRNPLSPAAVSRSNSAPAVTRTAGNRLYGGISDGPRDFGPTVRGEANAMRSPAASLRPQNPPAEATRLVLLLPSHSSIRKPPATAKYARLPVRRSENFNASPSR